MDNEKEKVEAAKELCSLVRQREQQYISGTTTISSYVEFSQYENIERIDAYLNSKHISGDTDNLGREKPFFNIVTAAVNIWYRATDIDRKNIRIKATKSQHMLGAFLATIHLQEWMKTSRFGAFLNEWGRSLAKYGSTVLKFVTIDKKLYALVIPWNRMISDTVDFENNVKIEKLYYTAAQLRNQEGYNQDSVKALIETAETARKDLDGQKKDNFDDYYEVYEVHGEFPLSYITGDEKDEDTYTQAMFAVSFQLNAKNEYEDFILYQGKEEKDPYMLTHLIKEEGRAQSIGAVEYLFDAQWMQNHTMKQIKDQLDLASLILFQTADGSFIGTNVLSSLENGDILIHTPNNPLTQVANGNHDINSLKTLGEMFYLNGQRITGATDAIAGNNMPANTPYSSLALMNQESHSLFEIMTENKGFAIEDMMREYIIPYIKTLMDTSDEIAATLSAQDIEKFDSMYIPNEAIRRTNKVIAEQMFNGLVAQTPDLNQAQNDIKNELSQFGNQRFIKPSDISDKTWKEIFADLEWEVEVEVTNEQKDKQVIYQTLTTVLQAIAADPTILTDPTKKMIFGKILEETGIVSSLEINNTITKTPPQPTVIPQASGGSPKSVGDLAAVK